MAEVIFLLLFVQIVTISSKLNKNKINNNNNNNNNKLYTVSV